MEISICPMCDSNDIKTITDPLTFQTPKGKIRIPNVSRQKCQNCGEEFFDHEANAVLDRYRSKQSISRFSSPQN